MGPDERWVGVDDVAAHLGVGKDSVYRWVESRGLPARKVRRLLLRFKLSGTRHTMNSERRVRATGKTARDE